MVSGLDSEILRKDLNVKKHFTLYLVEVPQRRGPLNNYEDVNPPDVHPYFLQRPALGLAACRPPPGLCLSVAPDGYFDQRTNKANHDLLRGKMQQDISGTNSSINTAAAKNNPSSKMSADAPPFIPTERHHEPYQSPTQHAPIMYPHAVVQPSIQHHVPMYFDHMMMIPTVGGAEQQVRGGGSHLSWRNRQNRCTWFCLGGTGSSFYFC